jgi:hypothetical protein
MITDPGTGKQREVRGLRKMNQIVMDAVSGKPITKIYVQATIIGRAREWLTFWPIKEFRDANPEIELTW